MHDTKMLTCWFVILLASMLASYFGYKAKTPAHYGGIFGTLMVYSFFGFIPMFLMFGILDAMAYLGVWGRGGDTDIGPALTPLLVIPIYWIGVLFGMIMSEKKID